MCWCSSVTSRVPVAPTTPLGCCAPVAELTAGEDALLALGHHSAELFAGFVDALQQAAGTSVGYLRCGTLLVARDADEAEALERELTLRSSRGLDLQRLRPTAARRLEPGLAPGLRLALDLPGDHAVDPRALVTALAAALRRSGGSCAAGPASRRSMSSTTRPWRAARRRDAGLAAGEVVIAAGVWSGRLGGLGDAVVPLRPVKVRSCACTIRPGRGCCACDPDGPSYITPRGDGRYVIGATSEERGFDQTVTAGAASELLRDASELVPGISEWVIDGSPPGCGRRRRQSARDRPARLRRTVLGGRSSAGGILLAPATAELIVDALSGRAGSELGAAFDPARFVGRPLRSVA